MTLKHPDKEMDVVKVVSDEEFLSRHGHKVKVTCTMLSEKKLIFLQF
jgi:hypothetical protein